MREQGLLVAGLAVVASAALLDAPGARAGAVPDLTRGETKGVDREKTWNLGPTGMRGRPQYGTNSGSIVLPSASAASHSSSE